MIPTCRGSKVYETYTSKLETRMEGTESFAIHYKAAPQPKHTTEEESVDWAAEFNAGGNPIDLCVKHKREQKRFIPMKALYDAMVARTEAPPPQGDFVVKVFAGKPGVGKTSSVGGFLEHLKRTNQGDYFTISSMNVSAAGVVWWDLYAGQHIIIIEEFENWIKFDQLKVLLDANHTTLQTKRNQAVRKNWNRVYITTNMEFDQWYA